jgi:hypothetical protein
MDQHVKALGVIHIAYGALGSALAFLVFIAVIGGGLISGESDAIIATSIVGTVAGFFLLLVFLPGVIGGIYLLQRQSWARILLIVVGALNLLNVPLGTALGIYTIWVLTRPEATRELSPATGP